MRFLRRLVALLVLSTLLAQPVAAQSVLRDAETEALFREAFLPLADAAGLGSRVDFVIVGDNEINAFVAGGQRVYINAGLLNAATNINEVQGVVAHELGHVAAGDVLRGDEAGKQASGISLLSLLLGAAAMAAGAGDAGAGILMAGQRAAIGKYLAFSRTQEAGADESGRRYLAKAGISGRGMVSFFKKLQGEEFRLAQPQDNAFERSHPLTGDRIQVLGDAVARDPAYARPTDPRLQARFLRIKAKLFGFSNEARDTLQRYPESDRSIPARYARAYAYHKQALTDRALGEADALLAAVPRDPYFEELKGQILLESGRPKEALAVLRDAVDQLHYQPLIAALFGHALVATEDRANFPEAKRVLKNAIARDNDNPFAWYQLGVIYAAEGDNGRASLASAERFNLQGQAPEALRQAQAAMAAIPRGTPDWLRAQDIAMVSRSERKRGRGAGS